MSPHSSQNGHHQKVYKLVQPLWRTVWRFLKKLGIELPYDSAYKGLYSQSYGFTSSYIWMWELDNVKGWEQFWGRWRGEAGLGAWDKPPQPRFIGLLSYFDLEAEAPILWPPDAKSRLIGKDPNAGKDWKQEEKGTTEDEMVGWHHQLDGQWVWVSSRSLRK